MSINHFSASDLPQTFLFTKHQQHNNIIMHSSSQKSSSPTNPPPPQFYHNNTASSFGFNLNDDDEVQQFIEEVDQQQQEEQEIPKEHLFEKPLTPSDVGKLNRLVIPKQHAEKYFPLNGNNNNNNSTTSNNNNNESPSEKGMLLSFEDESGKSWRFRYSYWNSSQSYVLTKGWSRFVKEKRLDAGDIVLFERHRLDGDRLFIGWRRRNAAPAAPAASEATGVRDCSAVAQPGTVAGGGGGGGWGQMYYAGGSSGHSYPAPGFPYQPDCVHAGSGLMQNQTTASVNNTRRQLRLFGVNMECEADESSYSEPPRTPDGGGSSMSSSRHQSGQQYYQYQIHYPNPHVAGPAAAASYNNNHHNHMDMNFSRDVNQMRYHQG